MTFVIAALEALKPGPRPPSGLRLASALSSDERLALRAKNGDSEAFGELVAPYLHGLEKLLRPLGQHPEDVHDLVQDALLRALRNLHLFEGGRFSTWLYRVAMNLSLTTARRRTLGRRLLDVHGPVAERYQEEPQESPEKLVEGREDLSRLRDAVSNLPTPCREVVELRYGKDLACKDIATMLGKTPNAVSLLLFRARRRLKTALA